MINAIGTAMSQKVAFKGAKISIDQTTKSYISCLSDKNRKSLDLSMRKLDDTSETNGMDVVFSLRRSTPQEVSRKMYKADECVLAADVTVKGQDSIYKLTESAGMINRLKVVKAVDKIGKAMGEIAKSIGMYKARSSNVADFFEKHGTHNSAAPY